MPELRQNYVTQEWVIIATERAKRPEDLATHRPTKAPAPHVENCPIYPGSENHTPPEVLRIPAEGNGAWQVRVIGNKFAALSPDIKPTRVIHRSRRSMGGFGIHDVIVESPNHAHATCLMADSHVADVLRAYKARYDAVSLDGHIAHFTMFKIHRQEPGASLEHAHPQLIAAPVISQQIRKRV